MSSPIFQDYRTNYAGGKSIRAVKIDEVRGGTLYFGQNRLTFNDGWMKENVPEVGDYLVIKDDNYRFYVMPEEVLRTCYSAVEDDVEDITARMAAQLREDVSKLALTSCSSILLIQILHTVEALEHNNYPKINYCG